MVDFVNIQAEMAEFMDVQVNMADLVDVQLICQTMWMFCGI